MLDPRQEQALIGGGDCFEHYHSEDRRATQQQMNQLQGILNQTTATANTTLLDHHDHVLVDTSAGSITITLPVGKDGKEYEITKTAAANTVTIVPSGTDTILGATGVVILYQWTSVRLKATTSQNWIGI